VIPALLQGRLVGNTAAQTIALAIDGRVAAVTETYRFDGAQRFYSLIPPWVFRDPPHSLRVLEVPASGDLRELAVAGSD
jgi:hypothetical protein